MKYNVLSSKIGIKIDTGSISAKNGCFNNCPINEDVSFILRHAKVIANAQALRPTDTIGRIIHLSGILLFREPVILPGRHTHERYIVLTTNGAVLVEGHYSVESSYIRIGDQVESAGIVGPIVTTDAGEIPSLASMFIFKTGTTDKYWHSPPAPKAAGDSPPALPSGDLE